MDGQQLEEALAALLYDARARARLRAGDVADPLFATLDAEELDEAASSVRRMVRERAHRGTGGVADWFPRTLAAWRAVHPDDHALDQLVARFCASPACLAWRETRDGISLEEAFYRVFVDAGVGDRAVAEEELLGAIVRALAITPRARFVWPAAVRRAPGGCFAVTGAAILHAALDGKYLRGPVTPLVAALLAGDPAEDVARRHALSRAEIDAVIEALRGRRLLR
jgi:hypothetical protein